MITIERTSVMNFENAIRGARNPMNSWNRMDSFYDEQGNFIMGPNDLNLAQRLARAGSDHRKFIRQIFVSVDFTAPLYWWKEYDTYKVAQEALAHTVSVMEDLRKDYLETKDKETWYSMIQLLPSSYHQMRTCTLNYETLMNIYYARRNHKLDEWHTVCDWIASLPYAKELILAVEEK